MRAKTIIVVVALLLVAAGRPLPVVAVFSPLASDAAVTANTQASPHPHVLRSRYVALNAATLPSPLAGERAGTQPDLLLELFPDVTVVATFVRFDPTASGVAWVGRVRDDARSHVTLVYGDGLLTGSIMTTAGTFAIRPAPEAARIGNPQPGGEMHVVQDIDQASLPREAEPVPVTYSADELALAGDMPAEDTADVIDVMVLYTEAARAHAGGETAIRQLIALGASETNSSYANSGVLQRIRVVHAALVPFTEDGAFGTNLSLLRAGTGAGLEGVAALRNQHGADLVKLLIHPSSPSACGVAYVMTSVSAAFATSGFSVTDSQCVSPGLTFAHELGHNMGAQHDWFVSAATLPYTYAHGYVNPLPGHRWRTIMAYNDLCTRQGFSCRRLVSWSNAVQFINPLCQPGSGFTCNGALWRLPGSPMGVPSGTRSTCRTQDITDTNCDADDRRVLNNTALTVANFRQSVAAVQRQR